MIDAAPTAAPATAPTRARRWLDPALVGVISLFAWFAGRPWAGFNTPDSEFYATLALFGSDVADRSLDPAYTWTRLGYIAPVRALTSVFGPWAGFGMWRLVLIVVIVGSVYASVRLASTRQLAVVIAGFTALNTVVLSFIGNTYLTGTILAATFLMVALALWQALGSPRRRWLPALLSGLVAGWLVMLNPYGLLLGMSMWLGVRAVFLIREPVGRWRSLVRDACLGVAGFVASFVILLLSGLVIFPGRNWFATYVEWNSKLDYSTFIGDASAWQRDLALLVPLLSLVISVIALLLSRARLIAVLAVVIATTNLGFTAAYLMIVPGPWLEAPTYTAKLWAGALLAIALAFAAIVRERSLGVTGWVVAGVALPVVLWTGRWDRNLTITQGLLIAIVIALLALLTAWVLRDRVRAWSAVLVMVAVAAFYVGAQVEQNGRGLVGSYGQFPFRAAYVDFDGELLMNSRIKAQEWILARTTSEDRIATWTDPDRLMAAVAAMQLWGWYNNLTSNATLQGADLDRLEQVRPTAIAMYAPERAQVEEFYASLPPWALPSPLECTTVPYLGVGNTNPFVCLTHLTWVN